MIREAEAYRQQRISTAEGDVARFNQIYSEYRKDKNTTKARIYLEKMESILQKPKKVIGTDSASGSITKCRDVESQAVFSLRGKPLNTFGLSKKVVYENEEFALLQAALGIEDDIESLRFNRVVIATDADVDGMHIRLLLLTFFLQFFPELIREGHLFILQTPLFRVRNKKKTIYCYDDDEREVAMKELGRNPEITRFKGLGEISPDEFKFMIGKDMRLDPVQMEEGRGLKEILTFYMGKNTPDRQEFIIKNLRDDVDSAEV